ncbi:MAG: hypothetical protein ACK4M6_11290 [Hyphomonas sp.]
MQHSLKTVVAVTSFLMAGTAHAMPASVSGWMAWEGQNEAAPRVIYTDASDQAGSMLACSEKGEMFAMLTLEPSSIPQIMKRNAPYARGSDSTVTVGEGEPTTARFRYTPARKTIESADHSVAAKVFNSAVKGETLTIKTQREGTIETTLPAPDAAFKAFAKTCNGLRKAAAE